MKNFMLKYGRLWAWPSCGKLLLLLAFVCLTCAITTGEIGAEPAAEPTAEPVVEPAAEPAVELTAEPEAEPAAEPGEEGALSLEQRMKKRISVEFRNTAIEDALMLMADQANVDIIKSPKVTGIVTVKLTDVPLEEALDNILAAHGYEYVTSRNMIRVALASEIIEVVEKIVTKTYRITYADVAEVASALGKFKSSQGALTYVKGTSNLIISDTESRIKAIDEFIEEIDRMTPQVLVEARIYDITSKDRLDIGVEWQAGRDTIFTTGGEEAYGTGRVSTVGANPENDRDPFITGLFSGSTGKTEGAIGALRFGWLNSAIDIDAVLRAQKEDIQAKLLANPRILVLDNETALFKIIEEIPYQQLTQGGQNSFGTTSFKEVGVTLEVTPHIITKDNMIRLQLKPDFSVDTGDVLVGGLGFPQPIIAKREADTTLLVKNGQSIVLGGLRKKDVSHQINKIPLLGDLPLIGLLFKFEGEETINSEIVVFVTPWIIEPMEPLESPVLTNLSETEKRQFEATEFSGPELIKTRAEKSED